LFVSLMLCQQICFGNSALKWAIETGLNIQPKTVGSVWSGSTFLNFAKLKYQTIGDTIFSLDICFSHLPNHKICQVIFIRLLEML